MQEPASGSARRRLGVNHPLGAPTPSSADIQMTQSIVEIARPLGIALHDHIIVGKEGHASFKGLRLILTARPESEQTVLPPQDVYLPSLSRYVEAVTRRDLT